MGRPKSKAVPPEQKALESTSPEETKAISKAEAVRQALADGLEAPGDIAQFVKENYGIEMPNQMISSYKTQEKAREAKKESSSPAAKRGPKPKSAAAPTAKATSGESIIDDIASVKNLVTKLGASEVRKIVGLFE